MILWKGNLKLTTIRLVIKRCIDLQSVEFLETFLAICHQRTTTSAHTTSYFDLLLASFSLREIYSCWHELPTPFQEDKHLLIETLRNSNLDRLLNYLKESDLGSAAMAWRWGLLFESLAGNIDLLKARPHVRVEPAVLEGLERRLAILNSLVESVRKTAEMGGVTLVGEEIASWGVYDNLVIAEKICSRLRNDGQTGKGTWILAEIKNIQRCEYEDCWDVTQAYMNTVRNPRAKQSWLQDLVGEHRKLDLEGQAETLSGLARCIRGRMSNDNELIYLRKILDHSYGIWLYSIFYVTLD
jgi:hypothetical protein